jgi:hypothetical protein
VTPFARVPSVITAETVKAVPAVEYLPPVAEYGEKPSVLSAQPFVTPAAYAAVPLLENEMDAEPLFAVARPEALGLVSKSHQIVGTRPVTSASAARTAEIGQNATAAQTTADSIILFIEPPIVLSVLRFYQKR